MAPWPEELPTANFGTGILELRYYIAFSYSCYNFSVLCLLAKTHVLWLTLTVGVVIGFVLSLRFFFSHLTHCFWIYRESNMVKKKSRMSEVLVTCIQLPYPLGMSYPLGLSSYCIFSSVNDYYVLRVLYQFLTEIFFFPYN